MTTPQPVNDIEIPEISDELAEALNRRYNPTAITDPPSDPSEEVEEVEDDDETEEEVEEEVEVEEVEEPEGFSLSLPDGRTVTLTPDQALAYYQFDQRLSQDPSFSAYLQSYDPNNLSTQGGGGQPPTVNPPPIPTPSSLPDDLDLDDPNIKYLVDTSNALREELANLRETASRHDQLLSTEQNSQANAYISAAQEAFKVKYEGLTDTDITAITNAAARTGMVATYMSGIDPISGLPVAPNPLAAMDLAMEAIYWSNPSYREKELARQATQQRADRIKKRKAGSLAGPSATAPRSIPNLKNERERREAMIAVVAEDMGLE